MRERDMKDDCVVDETFDVFSKNDVGLAGGPIHHLDITDIDIPAVDDARQCLYCCLFDRKAP